MRRLLMLVWFLAGTVPTVPGGLLELKSMIKKVTGKSALTSYGFYGCYCGWGGRGTPKDGTDWCCWGHDRCYGQLEESGCRTRTQSYKYRLSWGQVTCGKAGASHSGTERGSTSAVPRELGAFCQVQLCACDRNLVYCLKRNLQSYNPLYQYFPNFFCT